MAPSSLHPSPLPPHLRRPVLSQTNSHSSAHSVASARSGPHPQQHEYVPVFEGETLGDGGLGERAMFEEASTPIPPASPLPYDPTAHGSNEGEWPHLYPRDGSIARRPAWRRPRSAWIFPFLTAVALSMGMGMAPRQELLINLACLAHPPARDTASVSVHSFMQDHSDFLNQESHWHANGVRDLSMSGSDGDLMISGNSAVTLPVMAGNDTLSPADKWFLKLQHDLYEYRLNHPRIKTPSTPSSPPIPSSPTSTYPEPTSPLPKPGTPVEGDPPSPAESERPAPGSGDDNKQNGKGGGPFQAIDPKTCKKDPKVQAAAARLTMIMTLTMGLLSAITTGYWGQKSDKLGRTKIIAIVDSSLLINEICFILVATFPYLAPGGYRSLLIGPLVEGILGGFSTFSATVNAYISDVTPDGSRVTAYARLTGVMMCGMAIGPVLGSLLISATGNIMAPFYINVAVHCISIPMILFVLPESLSSDERMILSKNRGLAKEVRKRRDAAEREWESETPAEVNHQYMETAPLLHTVSRRLSVRNIAQTKGRKRALGNVKRFARRLRKPLDPLAIFLPRERLDGGRGKDWNLTAVGFGIFFLSMVLGVMQTKVQYAFYAFGWTSAQLGPYMSIVSFSRSFVLIVLIPVVMHFVKPRFFGPALDDKHGDPESERSAVGGESAFTITSEASLSDDNDQPPTAAPVGPKRSSALDLLTVRVCILLEVVPYILLTLGPGQVGFVIFSALLTLGSASGPAANSLALSLLPDSSQSGRLFGGIAVIHAIGATLISPLIYGNVFAATVGWYAPAVFGLAAISLVLSQLSFAFVRLNKKEDVESKRGRSRKIKRVPSTSTGAGRSGFAGAGASGFSSRSPGDTQ